MADEPQDDARSRPSLEGDPFEVSSGEQPIPRIPPSPPPPAQDAALSRGETPIPRVPPPED